jgi:ATP-dependent Lhr-like helicase
MFHEVFARHDPDNLLLAQSHAEVLAKELEFARIEQALGEMRARERVMVTVERPTPFAFPLMIERLRETVSTEQLSDRIARMLAELERAAQC